MGANAVSHLAVTYLEVSNSLKSLSLSLKQPSCVMLFSTSGSISSTLEMMCVWKREKYMKITNG